MSDYAMCRICKQESADHTWCDECEQMVCPESPWDRIPHRRGCPKPHDAVVRLRHGPHGETWYRVWCPRCAKFVGVPFDTEAEAQSHATAHNEDSQKELD